MKKLLSDKSKTRQNFHHHTEQSRQREGSFLIHLQKESILDRLKKGSLFRLSHQSKKQQDSVVHDDPYLNWLIQNSQGKNNCRVSQHISPNTTVPISQKTIIKQKKLNRNKLPKIKILASTQNSSFTTKSIHKSCEKPFLKMEKSNLRKIGPFQFKQKKQSFYCNLSKTQNYFLKQKDKNEETGHKNYCYVNNLSRTQLFKNDPNKIINNENQQTNIKSNYYLNDHKKSVSPSTFYPKAKQENINDMDLKRIKGLPNFQVKSFENNLAKLQKKAKLSCYNQLSQHFSAMKSQIQAFILQGRCGDQSKKQNIRERKVLNIPKQNELLSRIKTLDNYTQSTEEQDKQSYLPRFLRRSLISPLNPNSSIHSNSPNHQNLRS